MRGGSRPDASTPNTGQPTPTGVGRRKKGVGLRSWLVLHSSGQSQLKEEGKHAIMRRTGIPVRDLRILDPNLSYPSTVLGRERAILINMEHIKAIITAEEVLLLKSNDPSVSPFIEELQRRILCHHQATKPQVTGDIPEEQNSGGEPHTRIDPVRDGSKLALETCHHHAPKPQLFGEIEEEQKSGGEPHTRIDPAQGEAGTPQSSGDQGSEAKKDARQSLEAEILPFEFVALEACLEAAISSLEHEASRLELEANSALDKLTSKISNLSSERVLQIKSRMVAVTGRVQQVRDVLENLLEDDEDMAEMYLTEKLAQKLEDSSSSSMNESEVDLPQADDDDRLPPEAASEANRDESILEADDSHDLLGRNSHTSSTKSAMSNKLDVREIEMLLEAYFVQIDGTLNKLATLREYVEDTDDYVKMMQDDKQINLMQMNVRVTTATTVMGTFIAVAGVFGMNIDIKLFDREHYDPRKFYWTVIGASLGSLFLYFGAIGWFKYKRLLV